MRLTRNTGPAFAPSTPAALCPVAGAPVVERAAMRLARAGADEVLVVSGDTRIESWADGADAPVDGVTRDPEVVRECAAGHDRVVVVDGATLVPSVALATAADAVPAADGAATDGGSKTVPAAFAVPAAALADAASEDALDDLGRSAPTSARVAPASVSDVRRPWELLAANESVLRDVDRAIEGEVHPDAECRGAVVVEDGAEIDAGVVVEGPAFVSSGTTIGPNAYVRGRTFFDTNVHVGHSVEIKNSVVLRDADVPHLSYVGDSVVGPDANFGAGTIVANVRHDDADVQVAYDGDRVSTGRRKFGAVVGEGAKLGIGTHLNAGVTVGPDATTHPGEVLTRDRRAEGG
ncbi:glucose-1-phosphate thymidylyltransferase [Halobacterium jilantaiense]|nr:glucose-1-phosphate thymidylyltransferase [Halobacterium jilantaiense]